MHLQLPEPGRLRPSGTLTVPDLETSHRCQEKQDVLASGQFLGEPRAATMPHPSPLPTLYSSPWSLSLLRIPLQTVHARTERGAARRRPSPRRFP